MVQIQVRKTDIDVTAPTEEQAWKQVAKKMGYRNVWPTIGTSIGPGLKLVTITRRKGKGNVLGEAIVDYNP